MAMLAVEALAGIDERLAQLRDSHSEPLASGERAALWRAQREATRRGRSLDDLRRYCLEWLGRPRRLRAEEESDYVRGYRQGLQLVLMEIRRIESAGRTG
jgi:hypothetical protein